MIRFYDYFELGKTQAELDFVDIPLETDLALYVDPYALSLEHDPWFATCNDLVVGFFDLVVNSIKEGDTERARRLLRHLQEPNDTHLGLSSGRPRGRGVGTDQAGQIYDRLAASKAVRTGKLHDLADAELVIPGIGSDKISDITTNIIREPLIAYTQEQCRLLGVPMRQVGSGMYWDRTRQFWANRHVDLPVYNDRRIILVPKAAVRFSMTIDHQQYYRHFVLEYLMAEHMDAGSSLVTTLKNGRKKIHIKDISEAYPINKNFLFEFSEQHPEVLEQYKESLPPNARPLDNESIEEKQPDPRQLEIENQIEELKSIRSGNAEASKYHRCILGALTTIFYPSLISPKKEQEINQGRKRIDIVFTNRAKEGFFWWLNEYQHVQCQFVYFECKNYSADLENPEFDQLIGRFSDINGKFGFIVCRSNDDKRLIIDRCRDVVHKRREYILVLDDEDVIALLTLSIAKDEVGISDFLTNRFAQIVM
jgi:hypothetical protein